MTRVSDVPVSDVSVSDVPVPDVSFSVSYVSVPVPDVSFSVSGFGFVVVGFVFSSHDGIECNDERIICFLFQIC